MMRRRNMPMHPMLFPPFMPNAFPRPPVRRPVMPIRGGPGMGIAPPPFLRREQFKPAKPPMRSSAVYRPKPTFDMYVLRMRQKIKEAAEATEENGEDSMDTTAENLVQAAIAKHMIELTPDEKELKVITDITMEIQQVFEKIKADPGEYGTIQVEECKMIGSLKKGTYLRQHRVSDLVVVLKTLPLLDGIQIMAKRVVDELKSVNTIYKVQHYAYEVKDYGFDVTGPTVTVAVRIATIQSNLNKLDPTLHMPLKLLTLHLSALKHARWFEEDANFPEVKNFVRLIKDLKNRFQGFEGLSPWMIDVMAYHVVKRNPKNETLTEDAALRRFLQLLASGIFLPGSHGLVDPSSTSARLIHANVDLEKQDMLCMTAQNLLSILTHGGHVPILTGYSSIMDKPTRWNNIVVVPQSRVYYKPDPIQVKKEKEEGGVEPMDTK